MVSVIPAVIQRMHKAALTLEEPLVVFLKTAFLYVPAFFVAFALYTLKTCFAKTLVDVSLPHFAEGTS